LNDKEQRLMATRICRFVGIMLVTFAAFWEPRVEAQDARAELHKLFRDEWERLLQDQPTFASSLGDRRYSDRWPDVGLTAVTRRHQHRQRVLEKLKAIDVSALSGRDRTNYALFRQSYEMEVEGLQYRGHLLALNHRDGIQTSYELADALTFETAKDYEAWLARLRAFPQYVRQTIELLREGIKARIIHPKVVLARLPEQVAAQIVSDARQSPYYKPFLRFPASIPRPQQEQLADDARRAISEHVVPAFRELHTVLTREVVPAGFDRVGIWQFPRGKEAYAFYARWHTDTVLTPEEIHRIGLREVDRIRGEMKRVIADVGFKGSFEGFLHFLRTDQQFYYRDRKQLLEAYQALSKRIDPTLVRVFRRIPRMPYGVEAIPDSIAPDTTTAYYRPPAADGSRAGTYFVNLFRPETRPKYEMEALSLHEAVPGHHFQIALAMELGELPEFRRYGHYTSFVEGWALYAESLGEELGFYQDPYSKFGQLTYEMWRAVRLVVDTGMHYFGWTREQAIEFFKANAAKTELDIINEIDRYIAWPGQALAYKIGELKIKELRTRAARELGGRFDLRSFHEVVLGDGAVPLSVLESNVVAWIEAERKRG
jgi:uncharacterized protein (DUF885 family)